MWLIDAFVANPVKVTVGMLLVVLFGLLAMFAMPMQLTPEVQTPTITVQTRWPGASPQEVEQEIVLEQEEQLKSVEGITKMSSECADSQGTITLEFRVGTNMDEALLKVNSRLQQVPEYPEDADQPVISTSNAADRPIAWFILSARRPTSEDLDAFASKYPELADKLTPVREAHNVGVAMLRLRELREEHEEVGELLPPPSFDVTELRRFAEDEIESRFERVPGVSQSNVIGGLEDELQVIVDPERLAIRGLTIEQVRRVLQGQNRDTSAGDFWEGKRRWVVRALGQFRTPEQVESQLLAVVDGAPVYIRDVADVQLGFKKPTGVVRRFGESSIAINCQRESGANVLDVMDGLRETTERLDQGILKRRGLQLTQVYDETEYIESSVNLVRQNIFLGGALTVIVLMSFLHLSVKTILAIPLVVASALAAAYISPAYFTICLLVLVIGGFWFARGALVVALAIPTSIVGTFLIMGGLGRSLNVISLAGMAFAVGMLVDNAVVVLENIFRRVAEGEGPRQAAVRGTQEVLGAVFASTLTTIAVFLPVVFVEEQAGQLFRDIALAISGAVGLSLIVSMTLIPTTAARLFRESDAEDNKLPSQSTTAAPAKENKQPPKQRPQSWVSRISTFLLWPLVAFGRGFVQAIVTINAWIQRGFFRRLAVVVLLTGTAIGLSWKFWPKVEYLPSGNRNLVFGILLPPPGYNLEQLMDLGETVEDGLKPYWNVDPTSPEAAELDYPAIGDFFFVARGRSVFMGVRAHDPTRAGELVPLIQKVSGQIPGTFGVAKQSSLFEQGLTSGRTIDIEITGPDLPQLVAMGGRILGTINQIMPDAQARPVPSLDLSSPELHVVPKLVQSADMQVSVSELGYVANALIDGAYAGDYFLDGKKIDMTIKGQKQFANRTQDIEALPIATPLGQAVPLGALADVEISNGPEQINHRERVRAIAIEVSPPANIPLETAMQMIEQEVVDPLLASGALDGGYQINLAGTADKLRDTWLALRFNVMIALVITYLLMAALFESWLYPFVIILSVPLGAVGGILGLYVLNQFYAQPLDVLTMLGFVILIGTVVNNPILIVHQSLNLIREEGLTPDQAILDSIRTRVRPIFMTTTTTVLGLLPLVVFPGAGSELYRGLGSVVLGGLTISTLFTLFLVPTLFSLMMSIRGAIFGR